MKRLAILLQLMLIPMFSFSQGDNLEYWRNTAEGMSSALLNHFWRASQDKYYFFMANDGLDTTTSQYWPQAHAMDVVVDAYLRSGDSRYLDIYPLWWTGIPSFNYSGRCEDPWWNPYVDDMEWIALAQLRMYTSTGNKTYLCQAVKLYNDWIWPTWGPEDEAPWYGGITWCTDRKKSKNACSNGPAAIIASRLCSLVVEAGLQSRKKSSQYLTEAEKIYGFERKILFDSITGAVHDNINSAGRISPAVFSYNQGTFIGAAVELYKITGRRSYLDDALLAADYVVDSMTIGDAPAGDGALFHGILFRYMAILAKCADIDGTKYKDFLLSQGKLMMSEAVDTSDYLFSGYWHRKHAPEEKISLNAHLTGCMLAEAICEILK